MLSPIYSHHDHMNRESEYIKRVRFPQHRVRSWLESGIKSPTSRHISNVNLFYHSP